MNSGEKQAEITVGTAEDQPLQASKWLQLQMLIDVNELQLLFDALAPFYIFKAGALCTTGDEEICKEDFINVYSQAIEMLKSGDIPSEKLYRAYFSSVFTRTPDHLYLQPIDQTKALVRVKSPCLQLQVNRIAYSEADGQFRAMVFGPDSIFWGIQISYPQLYQDPKSKEVFHVKENDLFPNTSLFRLVQRWIRSHTIPTPFYVADKRTNTSMRIGKGCLSWINNHPQLIQHNIKILTSKPGMGILEL